MSFVLFWALNFFQYYQQWNFQTAMTIQQIGLDKGSNKDIDTKVMQHLLY